MFAMKLKIELRDTLFPMIIHKMFLQLNWSPGLDPRVEGRESRQEGLV